MQNQHLCQGLRVGLGDFEVNKHYHNQLDPGYGKLERVMETSFAEFRRSLHSRQPLIGSFLKTPSPIMCEVLGLTSLDAVCIDAEHAPFGRLQLDSCLHALRSAGMPSLVRTQSSANEQILNALDCGATGVVVPHVTSALQASEIIKSAHFGRGGRGYAGSTRAAGYTKKPMHEHLAGSETETTVVLQIEDVEAVEAIDEIAAVDGIDCLFVGRIDLTVAYGAESPQDPIVIDAVQRICRAAVKSNTPVGMFVSDVSETGRWIDEGTSLFLLNSDQGFVLQGAEKLCRDFNDARSGS
jgi:2-keto-3-deoxy-L-rhamnonate aldolase RhmA